jgi:hypothetical protein
MAGVRLTCECGRSVVVPSRGELREQAGLPAYEVSPVQLIERMLVMGDLPPPGGCVRCGDPDADVLDAVAECERVTHGDEPDDPSGKYLLLGLLFGVFGVFMAKAGEGVTEVLNVSVPVRACRRCRPLAIPVALPALLRVLAGVLLAGLGAIITWPLLGALLLVGAAGVVWSARKVGGWRQTGIKQLLARVPVYRRLLEKYPFADVTWRRARA